MINPALLLITDFCVTRLQSSGHSPKNTCLGSATPVSYLLVSVKSFSNANKNRLFLLQFYKHYVVIYTAG